MPLQQRYLLLFIPLTLLSATARSVEAAGRVELDLVTEKRVSVTAQQEWLRRLSQAGIADFRIRSGQPTDRVKVENRGSEAAPSYVVTGVITSDDELHVPGARFRSTEMSRLRQWLDDLGQLGPADRRPEKAAFGLNVSQFQQVHEALSRPVMFSTAGVSRGEVLEKIAKQLALPLGINPNSLRAAKEDKLVEELSGVSSGTALAYLVRPLGLCLVPQATASGGLELAIVESRSDMEVWPIGWKSKKPDRDVLPVIHEFFNVNLQGVELPKVLEALSSRLKVPFLLDYNAMARHGVEPEKVTVDFPQGRTTYSLLLRRVLFQARLKSELRVDEADKPLLWITTLKPI